MLVPNTLHRSVPTAWLQSPTLALCLDPPPKLRSLPTVWGWNLVPRRSDMRFLKLWWKQSCPHSWALCVPTQTTIQTWPAAVICMIQRCHLVYQSHTPGSQACGPKAQEWSQQWEVSNTHWGPTGTPACDLHSFISLNKSSWFLWRWLTNLLITVVRPHP